MTPPAGSVEAIHLTEGEGRPMRAGSRIRLIAGIGLEGDRYAAGRGHFSPMPGTGRALTLIEAEVLESLDVALRPGEARRNVTTRGIDLNALVGRRFRVGAVLCEGIELCEPCLNLARMNDNFGVLRGLVHRGGLRADVLSDGEIALGDPIAPGDSATG